MRLMAVLILLTLTVGCACVSETPAKPAVQPQPVIEQPTYRGETQHDYKAGAPDEHTYVEPVTGPTDNPYLEPDTYAPLPTTSGGGASTGWNSYSYYPPAPIPPVKVIIITGTVTVTKN